MKRFLYLSIMLLFCQYITLYAQLPYSFTNTAHIDDGGDATRIAIGPDSTIFIANGADGLRAYRFDGNSFTNTAHIDDNYWYNDNDVAVAPDGTIFLSGGYYGLRALNYDGNSFTITAHIDDGGGAGGIAVASDGTVFLANDSDGLRAYTYNGNSFTNTAHVYNGGRASRLTIAFDGTIFLANMEDGLRAYTYNGNSFTNTAHINDGGFAIDVVVAFDSTIFVANGDDGLRAYSYDGISFTNIANIYNSGSAWGITVSSENTIFLANAYDGLRAYSFDGNSFSNTAHINNGNYGKDVAVTSDGTILLANGFGGLRAYRYNSESFGYITHFVNGNHHRRVSIRRLLDRLFGVDDDNHVRTIHSYSYDGHSLTTHHSLELPNLGGGSDIAFANDDTIFFANGTDGLYALSYDGMSLTIITHINDGGSAESVDISSDGTIFLANGDDGMRAYTFDGNTFTNTAHVNTGSFAYSINVHSLDYIFLASDDGWRAYSYDGNSFTLISFHPTITCRSISSQSNNTLFSVNKNNALFPFTVFTANDDGLWAYGFDGSVVTEIAHVYDGGNPNDLEVAPDGTVFLTSGSDGMRAYYFDGSTFTKNAHISNGGDAFDVSVASDGTVFLASDTLGLFAYTYSGYLESNKYTRPVSAGWNLIGLPLVVSNTFYKTVYPYCTDNTLYGFNGSYFQEDSLQIGVGYWLNFPDQDTISILGSQVSSLTLDLSAGWNIISGPSCNVPLDNVSDPGNIIIANSLFGFDGAYFNTDTIKQGVGYWINTNAAGQITVGCETLPLRNAAKRSANLADLSNFPTLQISDAHGSNQKLHFKVTLEAETDKIHYRLPPLPPAGLFDARFPGNFKITESDEATIYLQASHYPLRITASNIPEIEEGYQYIITEIVAGKPQASHVLKEAKAIEIINPKVKKLMLSKDTIIPVDFMVGQNYPNPFNPLTHIPYALPEKTKVKIELYDILGRKIRTLFSGEQPAGYHIYKFEPNNLASGIYIYQIDTESGFSEAKKMLLLK